MRRTLKNHASSIIVGTWLALLALTSTSCCSMIKGHFVKGKWSDPVLTLSGIKYCWDADQSRVLVKSAYQISQKALLRYPYYIWKGTDWQREVTERINVISSGWEMAIIASNGTSYVPLHDFDIQTQMIHTTAGWALGSSKSISLIAGGNIATLYQAPDNSVISHFGQVNNKASVKFTINKGWQINCVLLDLENRTQKIQYTFDASGRTTRGIRPEDIVYLSTDPLYTIFVSKEGLRANTGILALGIDTTNNIPIRVIHPEEIAPAAVGYEWSISPDKKTLGFRLLPQGTLYITPTESPANFQIISQTEWQSIFERQGEGSAALPQTVELQLRKHIQQQILGQPDKNNYFKPIAQ